MFMIDKIKQIKESRLSITGKKVLYIIKNLTIVESDSGDVIDYINNGFSVIQIRKNLEIVLISGSILLGNDVDEVVEIKKIICDYFNIHNLKIVRQF